MQQISFYQAEENLMDKNIFTLAEKCYQANSRLLIWLPNLEAVEHINKLLWTFAQKKFIPHGSNIDPLPEKQPIYISDKLENPNKATILLIIDQNLDDLSLDKIDNFEKILILYGKSNSKPMNKEYFSSLIKAEKANVKYYTQNADGAWASK